MQWLAESVSDLFDYGQIKAPATEVLMAGAERWAAETAWTDTRQSPPASACTTGGGRRTNSRP